MSITGHFKPLSLDSQLMDILIQILESRIVDNFPSLEYKKRLEIAMVHSIELD